jgi:transposase
MDQVVHEALLPCARGSPRCDGIGPVTATAIVAAVGEAKEFKNGRHLAAWLGLVPRQHSSSGKSRLRGISKRGDA